MRELDQRPTQDAPDDDPHLWLEEIEGERPLAWAAERSAATLARFGTKQFEEDRDALAAIFDRPDKIPFVSRRGPYLYNLWQDAAHPRGLWRRTTLPDYAQAEPEWDVVLDIDALAAAENEDWIFAGASTEKEPSERAILRLSRGGGDAVVLREFDLTTRRFLDDSFTLGFTLPEAKGSTAWLDRDTLLLSSALGDGMATRSGYARTVRLWKRGADPLRAPVIFEVPFESMSASADVDRTAGGERIWFVERPEFFEMKAWLGDRDGAKTRLDLPPDAQFNAFGDFIAVRPRKPWSVAGVTHPADRLLRLSLPAWLGGERRFVTLFEPGERRVLQSFFWCAGRLVVSILDDLAPRFEVVTPSAEGWAHRPIDALPRIGAVSLSPLDANEEDSNGEILACPQDPLTPPQLLLIDVAQPDGFGAPTLLKRSPEAFDAAGLVVTRHDAVSIDGEAIPYVQIGPAGETGEAPVHLTGYGGFSVSVEPVYRSAIGKLWLERGGTGVIANIRGGGEFGTRWHEAGRREGKRLAHDDFAAVAADLVRRGVTRPDRIAAEGGSNGGLLVANMLTRYPERFGALFCTIPLIDMRRYSKLLAGASWMAEYGDPDKPEDWSFLKEISAYHLASAGKPYPPILIATTRRDDRVHPGHARKMASKLQGLGYEAHFYEPAAGGHGYGKDNAERAAFLALGYAFLRDAIGWPPWRC
ncbi:prolyl oligopeptidase [Rhizobiales bacterium GAS113]|nr:prolyl oligopeptidase [Rhizobiales bacterium GAS113]